MKWNYLIIFLFISLQTMLINPIPIESIQPFENKTINLNNEKRYIVYELDNLNEGTIYVYFKEGEVMSTEVSVYYNMSEIKINEEKGEILDYIQKDNLHEKKFLKFTAYIGKMYFVISNFIRNIDDEMHIINKDGYYDITNYDSFKYLYNFDPVKTSYDRETITFSFKNDVKQKNYLYYQINHFKSSFNDYSVFMTKNSQNKLIVEENRIVDISNFKNETINIQLAISSGYEFKAFEIVIYYSEYKNVFPILNIENSLTFIPSIKNCKYYVYVDLEKAYRNIFLKVKTEAKELSGKYFFYETNKIQDVIDKLPGKYSPGPQIKYSKLDKNYIEAEININETYYKSLIIIMDISSDAEYKVNFFKDINIDPFQNQTFILKDEQRFIIYKFNDPTGDFIYTYFKNGNNLSTYLNIYYDFYKIFIDKNNNILDYNERIKLNANIFKFSLQKGSIYILISNFDSNFTDTISIINPNGYYDITQYKTFQYFYQIPNNEDSMTITFSFNNKIISKNFLNYQIYNYQDHQIDNSQITDKKSMKDISIYKYDYGGIINLTNFKNDYIDIKFKVSSKTPFNSIIISIYYSEYKNLYNVNIDNEGYFYIPSSKTNQFFIYTDISNIYKNIYFLLQTESKEISNKYYFYEDNDINKIYTNLPKDNSDYDGIYTSNYLENNQLEIHISKTKREQKLLLLKMEINSNINISSIDNKIYKIKPFENKIINLNSEKRYIIYELENEKVGTIFVYFKIGGVISTEISVYYNMYDIKIDEENKQILNYKQQDNLQQKTFLKFSSFIGKMYFVVSNFITDFTDEMHIINIDGYYDITNYDSFKYLYNFEGTKTYYESKYITFSFKNDIKQKNYLYYQLYNSKSINDLTEIRTENSQIKFAGYNTINMSSFKNETINIKLAVTSGYAFNSFELLIYFSDYNNIFILNNSAPLILPSIYSKDFFIFIKLFNGIKKLFLSIETNSTIKENNYYFYETNQIKEIEKNLPDSKASQEKYIPKLIRNNYEIYIDKAEYYHQSILIKVNIASFSKFNVCFYSKAKINTFEKKEFQLKEDNKYIIFEYYYNSLLFFNKFLGNKNQSKLYIYFNENNSDLIQVDIFKSFSDVNIDEVKGEVKDSFISLKLENRNFIELENINDKICIVISNFLNNNFNKNSIQIIKNDEFYDISSKDIYQYNFKFMNTTEKQFLSFKINTQETKYKYLHFQIYNHKSNQIEDFIFKSLSGEIINFENNCINLQDNPNQIILMNFGLSSNEPMDNYDIILRQSNYKLIYPFNSNNEIEIPFIKNYSFYIFTNFSENSEYIFNTNSNQEEIEYFYLDKEEFNEKTINISNLKSIKLKTVKEKDNREFIIKKKDEKNKAVIFKINIDNGINFKINRDKYKSDEKSEGDENEKINENSGPGSINALNILLIIICLIIIVAIGIYICRRIFRERHKNQMNILINDIQKEDGMLHDLEEDNSSIITKGNDNKANNSSFIEKPSNQKMMGNNDSKTPFLSNDYYQKPIESKFNFDNNIDNNNINNPTNNSNERESINFAPPPAYP